MYVNKQYGRISLDLLTNFMPAFEVTADNFHTTFLFWILVRVNLNLDCYEIFHAAYINFTLLTYKNLPFIKKHLEFCSAILTCYKYNPGVARFSITLLLLGDQDVKDEGATQSFTEIKVVC